MKKLLRLIVSVALFSSLLVGCAGKPADDQNIEKPNIDETSIWPITHIDSLGREVVIQQRPERPVMIFFRNLEHLFILDEPPIAGTEIEDVYEGWEMFQPYANTHEIIDLGMMSAVNVEKLLEVEPDLIFVFSGTFEKIGEQLEKIAPTIAVNNYGDDWQTPLLEYGKILGKEEQAQTEVDALIGELTQAAQEFSEYEGKTFAFLKMASAKEFTVFVLEYVYNKEEGLGLNAPEGYLEKGRSTISVEGLAEFNPDYLFVYNDALDELHESILEELSQLSVWNKLEAVQNEHVFLIDRSAFSGGPLSIRYGIEHIQRALK